MSDQNCGNCMWYGEVRKPTGNVVKTCTNLKSDIAGQDLDPYRGRLCPLHEFAVVLEPDILDGYLQQVQELCRGNQQS